MRILVVLAALVGAAAILAAAVIARDGGEGRRAGAVTLVGDSLNVGIEPYLEQELQGWTIRADDVAGRSTASGLESLRALGARLEPTVVVSLGTNDPEGQVEAFRRLVAEALELVGPRRCLVWATIVRDGVPRTGQNQVLRDAAGANGNLRLVDWATMVAGEMELLAADLVHGTEEGYARRAAATADAVRACSGEVPAES